MLDISGQLSSINRAQEESITQTLARNFSVQYVNLINYQIADHVLSLFNEDEAKINQIAPYMKVGSTIWCATPNLLNETQETFLKQKGDLLKVGFKKALCSQTSFEYCLSLYQKIEKNRSEKAEKAKLKEMSDWANVVHTLEDISSQITKVSTTEMIDLILAGAVNLDASDIHIEPANGSVRLRYRLDGVLKDISDITNIQYKAVLARVKNLSRLKLDIANQPQDGRFEKKVGEHTIDVRVSVLPTAYGEAVVMRILLEDTRLLNLDELGFNSEAMKLINEAILAPNGLILNTGPTGSGKTTTLYSILNKLNKPEVKIITIEDPIEYRIKGIDQTQVNLSANYTFASALRSVVRQDPDIIMVGEIRDNDTADIALHASITGHLVLSTLHTNTAAAAIPRMLNMNAAPYLLAGSINLIIAQRLVRKICTVCQNDEIKKPQCKNCGGTGYKGRLPIIEALKPTKDFNDLIVRKATLEEFQTKAKQIGMKTMFEDGMEKVKLGLTSEAEVRRVTMQ
ncbi:MAG: putative ATPases involved in pili biogenesis, PilB-like protein s [Berkelbacteria bacterium GW2011_GWA2_35_9]|uniref:Putative ATPases involved in pili biogenesis, PilB-like protein s n=1 Tax=Berkelbacteria bacterium GW2011_GWA2_35_9 TaxID=1618333 RepID=A0A0G0DJ55_9BACT|nr:MAG: putative ATPases involved in pili biogenesis, PilB-like protein s [Berkelbacteria bacterium GW2011_GWA2_35_9]